MFVKLKSYGISMSTGQLTPQATQAMGITINGEKLQFNPYEQVNFKGNKRTFAPSVVLCRLLPIWASFSWERRSEKRKKPKLPIKDEKTTDGAKVRLFSLILTY